MTKKRQQPVLKSILNQLYTSSRNKLQEDWYQWLHSPNLVSIFTPNPEQVVQAQQDPAFATVILSADVLLPDGIGLVMGAKLLKRFNKWSGKVPARITGRQVVSWWLQQGYKQVSKDKQRTFLLGAYPGVALALAREIDPGRTWCQGSAGFQDIRHPKQSEKEKIKQQIQDWSPAVVLVAFGAPWQETWISQNREWLQKQGVKVVMAVGGSLDVLSPASSTKAPPTWIQKLNLEWLYRLFQEPWRWKRQLRLVNFIKLLLQEIV